MLAARRNKLVLTLTMLLVLALAVGLVLYALRQNISLFYTPTQVVNGEAPPNHSLRVGGMVVPGSVARGDDLWVRFDLTDYEHTIRVSYRGILPDLFREGQGIVAQGALVNNHEVQAQQVLAKHDEKYMPPEVKATLKSGITNGSTSP